MLVKQRRGNRKGTDHAEAQRFVIIMYAMKTLEKQRRGNREWTMQKHKDLSL